MLLPLGAHLLAGLGQVTQLKVLELEADIVLGALAHIRYVLLDVLEGLDLAQLRRHKIFKLKASGRKRW